VGVPSACRVGSAVVLQIEDKKKKKKEKKEPKLPHDLGIHGYYQSWPDVDLFNIHQATY
jgi:hypothetical protein